MLRSLRQTHRISTTYHVWFQWRGPEPGNTNPLFLAVIEPILTEFFGTSGSDWRDGCFPCASQRGVMRLTVKSSDGLKLKAGQKERIAFDDDIPGFGLRIREGGSRSWIFQYRIGKKQRRMVLGTAN